MPAVTTEQMRKLLDEIEREAKEADGHAELEQVKSELAELKARIDGLPDEIRAQLAPKVEEATETVADNSSQVSGDSVEDEPEEEPKPKMRRGRKRGQVYQDAPGELAYVYDGEDEPDLVPVEEAAA